MPHLRVQKPHLRKFLFFQNINCVCVLSKPHLHLSLFFQSFFASVFVRPRHQLHHSVCVIPKLHLHQSLFFHICVCLCSFKASFAFVLVLQKPQLRLPWFFKNLICIRLQNPQLHIKLVFCSSKDVSS